MANATISTMNRKLEQVLFELGVHHLQWDKNDDGMTVWIYPNTEKVRQIMAWFREANESKRKAGW